MSLLPRLTAPAFTPLELGYALTERQDVGRLEYWGAVAGQSFEESLLGARLRNIPPAIPSLDEFADEAYQAFGATEGLSEAGRENLREAYRSRYDAFIAQYSPLTAEDWQASPSFREAIPYEDGMTVERAAALAEFHDDMAYYDWIRENHAADWISTIGAVPAAIGGAMASPEAFVPIVGPAARGAIAARLGVVGGRAATGAIEGAVGTAAVLPFISSQQALIGREFTLEDMLIDVAIGALAGSALGTAGGLVERRRQTALQARQGVVLTDARAAGEAVAGVRIAMADIAAGRQVDVPPPSRASVDAMLEGLSVQESALRARERALIGGEVGPIERSVTTLRRAPTEDEIVATRSLSPEQRGVARRRIDAETVAREAEELRPIELGTPEAARAEQVGFTRPASRQAPRAPRGIANVSRITDAQRAPLTRLERMALYDPSPRVREAARAEIDRRLAQDGTTAAARPGSPGAVVAREAAMPSDPVLARTPDTGDASADIDAKTVAQEIADEQGIAEDGTFAELADWERMDAEDSLTPAERATFAEAEAAVAKAANAEAVYEVAAACLLRAAA